jgi:hypothetical protein
MISFGHLEGSEKDLFQECCGIGVIQKYDSQHSGFE